MLGSTLGIIWLVLLFIMFAVPLMVFFARLSMHYVKLFTVSPETALEYQNLFSKSSGQAGPASGASREIAYVPFRQLQYLAEARLKHAGNPELDQLLNMLIWDLRLTLIWFGLGICMAIAALVGLFV